MDSYDDDDNQGQDKRIDDELLAPIVPLRQRADKPGGKDASGQDETFWSVFDLPDDPTQVLERTERPDADVAPGRHASAPDASDVDYGEEQGPRERPRRRRDGVDGPRRGHRLLVMGAAGLMLAAAVAVVVALVMRAPAASAPTGQASPVGTTGSREVVEQPGSPSPGLLPRSEHRHPARGHKASAPATRAPRAPRDVAVTTSASEGPTGDATHPEAEFGFER